MEEDKRLDFNAPLLSVRRFSSAPAPAPPSSSPSPSAAAASRRTDVGGGAGRPGRSSLPFYKSDLKSGPVQKPGVVPFVWEQSPGRPKGGGLAAADLPSAAPKPPPGRSTRRPNEEKEEPISTGTINATSRSSPMSSSPSTRTTTAITTTSSFATSSKSVDNYMETSKRKAKTNPVVDPVAEAPILEEHRSGGGEDNEEEDAFSDALDTISRTESCFMNYSVSGFSAGTEARVAPGGFSTDPHVRDFMMGRFLLAAQALATGSPQCAPWKVPPPPPPPPRRVVKNGGECRRPAAPLPYQHRSVHASAHSRIGAHQTGCGNSAGGDDDVGVGDDVDDDNDDDGYDEGGHLSVKGCGVLPRFCLRSSFCLLNPVPGVNVRGRVPLPPRGFRSQLRVSQHGSLGVAEDEYTWEEVCRHKLGGVHQSPGEEGSKLTSESNHLLHWSHSQTPAGSSPYRRSNGGGVSPYRNEMPLSPFHEGNGFLGVPICGDWAGEDGGHHYQTKSHLGSKQAFGSLSPVVEKTVYVDSVRVLENRSREPCSSDANGTVNRTDEDSEIGRENQRIEASPSLGTYEDLQHEVSKVVIADELHSTDRSGPLVDPRQNHVSDGLQPSKTDDRGNNDNNIFQDLLPPPMPKPPSESWLWHTLPSISSRNSNPQSFLGLQFCPKKQVVRASSTDSSWETMVKTVTLPKGQI